MFLAFAVALRDSVLTGGQPLTGSTVERTIQVCGQVLAERGFDDPCQQDQSQPCLDPAFARYLQRCKQKDPAPVQQIGLPSTAVKAMARTYQRLGNAWMATVGDLIVAAFFFLLRVGEYTPHPAQSERCTVPLQKADVKLWRGTQRLDSDAE